MDKDALLYDQDFDLRGMAEKYRAVLRACRDREKILEIGCNTGALLKIFHDEGKEVLGVEKSKAAADKARENGLDIIQGDVESDAVRDQLSTKEPFDAILLLDVLEHLVNPWAVLRSLRAWISKNGKALVTLPNVAFWRVRFGLLAGRFDYRPAGILDADHLRFFTQDSAGRMFRDAGWNTVSVTPSDHEVPLLGSGGAGTWLLSSFPGLFARVFLYELEVSSEMID